MKSRVCILLILLLSWPIARGASAGREPNAPAPSGARPPRAEDRAFAPGRRRAVPGQAEPSATAPEPAVTEHTIRVNGQPLRYRATAGYLPLEGRDDKVLAHIFYVAYERLDTGAGASLVADRSSFAGGRPDRPGPGSRADSNLEPVTDIAQPVTSVRPPSASDPPRATSDQRRVTDRPIAFAFNGGPGASAVWLHMGGLGPKRAVLGQAGTALPPADRIVDNDATWLTFTDLVFVDPIGTGFSRAAPGVDPRQFYAFQKDLEIAADFVRLFVTKHERWLAPQFIVGESYGTTRAVGMTRRLQDRYGLYVRGLVLLSAALNLQAISFDPGNDLPYALSLPSYTAVSLYHGRLHRPLSSDLDRSLQRVGAWALGDYVKALAEGSALPLDEFQATARSLAEYTGLSEDLIARNRLRVSNFAFTQELLSDKNQVLGLLDGRVTAPAIGRRGTWTDPSLFTVEGPFVAAFNDYVRTELGFQADRPYIFLSDRINESWDWSPGRQGYLNVAPLLAEAMELDQRLAVFAAAGYYDLTTPFLSQEYVYNHLGLPAGLRPHVTLRHYHSGHQIYTAPDALKQLTADVQAFLTAVPAQ